MNARPMPVPGRRVTVMGLGLFGGGLGTARWALRHGAHVTVTDLRSEEALAKSVASLRTEPDATRLRFVLGRHEEADFERADMVIVNPAVPPSSPFLRVARGAGARVTTSTALLLERLRARVVAITGTHGKSSTARFTRDLIRAAAPSDARVLLGGNIGGSLLGEIETLGPRDVVVLELSSYQLEHLALQGARHGIDVAAITNIGVDHLERHGTVEAYRQAKFALLDLVRPGGVILLPQQAVDPAGARRDGTRCLTHGPGGDVSLGADGVVRVTAGGDGPIELGDAGFLRVPGDFQRQNLAVALGAAHALDLDPTTLAFAIPDLRGLPHRMESLGIFEIPRAGCSVEVVDNGVSTTPESTLAAVESICAETHGAGCRILVAGGQAKRGLDDASLAERLARDDWTLVPFGDAAEALAAAGRAAGARVAGLSGHTWPTTASGAAEVAFRVAAESELGARPIVLFSPACASFDHYPNFEARASAFREAITALSGSRQPTERRDSIY